MKINQSELATNLPDKTNKQPKTSCFILFISFLLVLILAGYFIWRKIQLNAAQKLVYDCSLNNNCSQITIIEALEKLVKAQKKLKLLNLSSTNLEDANLQGAHIHRANLSNAKLKKANLKSADIYLSNLSNANLSNANLKDADVYRANFSNANLKSVDITNANLSSAILIDTKNLTPTQIKSACNWENAFYKGQFDDDYEEWIIDKQANQQFIELLQQAHASDPKQPVDCSAWK